MSADVGWYKMMPDGILIVPLTSPELKCSNFNQKQGRLPDGCLQEEYGLSDRQSTAASDRTVEITLFKYFS